MSNRQGAVLAFSVGAVIMAYGLVVVLALPPRWMPLGAATLIAVTAGTGAIAYRLFTRRG